MSEDPTNTSQDTSMPENKTEETASYFGGDVATKAEQNYLESQRTEPVVENILTPDGNVEQTVHEEHHYRREERITHIKERLETHAGVAKEGFNNHAQQDKKNDMSY